jgi:hypothetical protein
MTDDIKFVNPYPITKRGYGNRRNWERHMDINHAYALFMLQQAQKNGHFSAKTIYTHNKLDGDNRFTLTESSVTPAAGKYAQIISLGNLGSLIASFDSTEDNLEVIIDEASWRGFFDSTTLFSITPFIVNVENGESVPTTDFDSSDLDPLTAIDSAVTGHFKAKIGEIVFAKRIFSNNQKVFIAECSFDFTSEMRRWTKEHYKKGIEEQDETALFFGIIVTEATANTAVNYQSIGTEFYHFQKNSKSMAI